MAIKVKKAEEKKTEEKKGSGDLSALRALIQKTHGKEALMDNKAVVAIPRISTGNLEFDLALGGGAPVGRIIEIYGPEESGKTTFALSLAAHAQKKGMNVGIIDAEHALDEVYAGTLGLDVTNSLVSQPDSGEQALQIADLMIESGQIQFLLIDSVAALVPKAELEGEIGKGAMGAQARLMSTALRQLIAKINRKKVTVVFTNQMRMKIGVMFGNPETTSGGNSLKYYASIRIDMRKSQIIKDGETILGQESNVSIIKNKTARKVAKFPVRILYGVGFDNMQSVVNVAERTGVLVKNGAWYSYNGQKMAQGTEKMKEVLANDKKLCAEITKLAKEKYMEGVKLVKLDDTEVKTEATEDMSETITVTQEVTQEQKVDEVA